METRILGHLEQLVAFDTQNPPRQIESSDAIFEYLRQELGSQFQFEVTDHGRGRVALLASRGQSRSVFNVHLDTVPYGEGWRRAPASLTVEGGRAYGRGTCDIKGAAACLLTAVSQTDADVNLLFTTDEEGTENCCVREFCRKHLNRFDFAVVAEPTEGRGVTQHRGYLSVIGEFAGVAGHSSQPDARAQSANHRAVRWAAEALRQVEAMEAGADAAGTTDFCFNLGQIEGGQKNNVVSDRADVGWSVRLPPGFSNDAVFEKIVTVSEGGHAHWRARFSGPPLPVDPALEQQIRERLSGLKLVWGEPVEFWTEASLFAEVGIPAVVLGPGNIGQAHTADEWVEIEQLVEVTKIYQRIMQGP